MSVRIGDVFEARVRVVKLGEAPNRHTYTVLDDEGGAGPEFYTHGEAFKKPVQQAFVVGDYVEWHDGNERRRGTILFIEDGKSASGGLTGRDAEKHAQAFIKETGKIFRPIVKLKHLRRI